ncbi:hypothetical protein [Hyalangium minutum]|uniref:hypothetical protein n=1 Tax=Hyalangium minutum TaxID=394096 RepID=UPI0014705D89|nr:hypothetical protein [Hyalangium minutum]
MSPPSTEETRLVIDPTLLESAKSGAPVTRAHDWVPGHSVLAVTPVSAEKAWV